MRLEPCLGQQTSHKQVKVTEYACGVVDSQAHRMSLMVPCVLTLSLPSLEGHSSLLVRFFCAQEGMLGSPYREPHPNTMISSAFASFPAYTLHVSMSAALWGKTSNVSLSAQKRCSSAHWQGRGGRLLRRDRARMFLR